MNFIQKFFSHQPATSVKFIDVKELNTDEEFKHLGMETVQKAYELLESGNWKVEKVTSSNDTISTSTRAIGKVYKLTARVEYSPKKLLQELFYNIESVPEWNPTLLESKIIRKIDNSTDIAYSVSASGGGGLVKSRDFVNLRCWKLIRNGHVVENYNINNSLSKISQKTHSSDDGDNENSSDEGAVNNEDERRKKSVKIVNENFLKKSASDNAIVESPEQNENIDNLSKSLGAAEVICVTSEEDEPFADAQTELKSDLKECCFVSAAMSIEYPLYPPTSKYIRGDNIISCWAMKSIANEEDACIFEWLLCIDLKGSLPKYVLNTAFVSLMTDYMGFLRTRVQQLNNHDMSNCA